MIYLPYLGYLALASLLGVVVARCDSCGARRKEMVTSEVWIEGECKSDADVRARVREATADLCGEDAEWEHAWPPVDQYHCRQGENKFMVKAFGDCYYRGMFGGKKQWESTPPQEFDTDSQGRWRRKLKSENEPSPNL